tara:strand:+ start:14963 stop:15430 length:468 start_codon:yes stop_codon:yes gene_type:complete
MKTKTKNIIIISSIVAVGVGGYFLINYLLKPKLTDEEKKLIEEMGNANKGTDNSSSSSSDSSTDTSSDSSNTNMLSLPSDAKIILNGLSGWTTDNDEALIVSTVLKYNSKNYKELENYFNNTYKRVPRYRMLKMTEWIEDDLSDDNYNKIKNIMS